MCLSWLYFNCWISLIGVKHFLSSKQQPKWIYIERRNYHGIYKEEATFVFWSPLRDMSRWRWLWTFSSWWICWVGLGCVRMQVVWKLGLIGDKQRAEGRLSCYIVAQKWSMLRVMITTLSIHWAQTHLELKGMAESTISCIVSEWGPFRQGAWMVRTLKSSWWSVWCRYLILIDWLCASCDR